jgi:CRISPR-associated protein Cas1
MTQLIINKRGASLLVRGGRYLVRTHEAEAYVPVYQVRSIHLHPATKLSYEVIVTAIEHNTDILFVDRKGFPVGRVWSHHFGSISTIRKNQLRFAQHPDAAGWVREVLLRKAEGQTAVLHLLSLLTDSPLDDTLRKMGMYRQKIEEYTVADLSDCYASFRGYEGSMSRAYFGGINAVLPEEYRFGKRSQHPAQDAFNCLLNYAYGMLYGQCESALIKAGLDPFIGILHRDEYNRPVLVYDFIELFRHWADYVVCHLCLQQVVVEEFFQIATGQYWLDDPGKRILIQSMNDYLSEVVEVEGLVRSRQNHLELEAQRLAARLKKYAPSE